MILILALKTNLDLGFAILQKLPDDPTPSLHPYKRIKGIDRGNIVVDKDSIYSSASAIIVLFDNTYSTMRQKSIKYTFKVEGSVTATVDRVAPASFSSAIPSSSLSTSSKFFYDQRFS